MAARLAVGIWAWAVVYGHCCLFAVNGLPKYGVTWPALENGARQLSLIAVVW